MSDLNCEVMRGRSRSDFSLSLVIYFDLNASKQKRRSLDIVICVSFNSKMSWSQCRLMLLQRIMIMLRKNRI